MPLWFHQALIHEQSDSGGAERLLGYGDMLYLGSGMNKPIRVQGTFVSDDEIDGVVDFIKHQREPDYLRKRNY